MSIPVSLNQQSTLSFQHSIKDAAHVIQYFPPVHDSKEISRRQTLQ